MCTTECPSQTNPPSIKFWEKMKALPRVNEEYQNFFVRYEKVKQHYWKIGHGLNVVEFLVLQLFNILANVFSSESPFSCWISGYALLMDSFACHQLEFLEKYFESANTEWIYKPNGLVNRTYLWTCLALRFSFIFPRILYRMVVACVLTSVAECSENFDLFLSIVNPPRPRRSRRVRVKKEAGKREKSPGKKRKHEETVEASLPGYFYVHECSQESDPDFIPNSDGDDTEITSASDNSYTGDDNSGAEELEVPEPSLVKDLEIMKANLDGDIDNASTEVMAG